MPTAAIEGPETIDSATPLGVHVLPREGHPRWIVVCVVVILLLAAGLPGIAAAQQGIGGSFVVEEGETVDEVTAVGGAVVVHGTVTGDVSGAAGNVLITGTVEGDVTVATGNLRIAGDVHGDVAAGAGQVRFDEGSTVGGNVDLGAGEVQFHGEVGGDVRVGAETIRLGETAAIAGALTYDGHLVGNEDVVAGEITRDRTVAPFVIAETEPIATSLVAVYAFIANLVLGAVLLALVPQFSRGVADRVATDPITTGLVGLGTLFVVPLLLVLLTITIIGIPFALAGTLLFLVVVWVGLVYGRFALGMWLLSPGVRERVGSTVSDPDRISGFDRMWVALVLGLLLGVVFGLIPILSSILNFLVFLLGMGGLTVGLYGRFREGRPEEQHIPEERPTG